MPPAAPMRRQMKMAMAEASAFGAADMMAPKEIKKEGLSEYFLYTIAGTETIPHGWSKRLPSLTAEGVPVVNLYKFEEERYGKAVIHVLSFKNDKAHKLGETPLPGGNLKVFRTVDADAHLGYVGESAFQYIPVDEDVELSLGPTGTVLVEPTLMDTKTENFMFDRDGNIDGWDEWQRFKVEVNNTRTLPVRIEIQRQVGGANTEVKPGPDSGTFEQVDLDTVKFTLTLAPQSEKTFHYEVRTRHGRRAN